MQEEKQKVEEQVVEEIAIEAGAATPSEIKEILEQRYLTITELADKLGYTPTWIQMNCKSGRIRAIKPMGGRWRISESEAERIIKEGIPPLPREEKRPPPTRIEVPEDKVDKVVPHRKEEVKKEEEQDAVPWPLSAFFKRKPKGE